MTLVLVVRHGLTSSTGKALTGWLPGITLDDRGQAQAAALPADRSGYRRVPGPAHGSAS
jgi:broad specificity phosphatase PhoE